MYNKNQRKQTTNKLVTFKIGKNATLAANKQHKDKWAYTKYSITPFAFIPLGKHPKVNLPILYRLIDVLPPRAVMKTRKENLLPLIDSLL